MRSGTRVTKTRALRVLIVAALLLPTNIHLSGETNAADATKRISRPLDVIPRPTDLRMGLAQIQYKGYFADDTSWFTDARAVSQTMSNTTTQPSGLPIFDGSTDLGGRTSFSWTGYFIPDITGSWEFQIASDDASYLWIGNDAIVNYQNGPSTALISNGGIHAELVKKAQVNLVKDKIYPLRIQYGNDTNAAVFRFQYRAPGFSDFQSDFTTLLWRSSGGAYANNCTNFGLSYTLVAELGYDRIGLPQVCKNNGDDPNFKNTWVTTKPENRSPRELIDIPRPEGSLAGLHEAVFSGYWAESPEMLINKSATRVSTKTRMPSYSSENFGIVETYMWSGYFVPDISGEWFLKITSDDASRMWVGNDAIQNWMFDKNSAQLAVPPGSPTEKITSIVLKKDFVYPFRILYGNSGGPGTFKFEVLPPGIGSYQTDTSGLFFHTPISYCTNWGISYLLMPKYGYDQVVPNSNCKEYKPQTVVIKSKPKTPLITSLKMIESGLFIEAALGDIEVKNIELLSPSIGYTSASKLSGKISGKIATFIIPMSKLKSVSKIDINLISSNDDGNSTTSRKAVPVVVPSKSPTPIAKPTPAATKKAPAQKSIKCSKGDKSRTFVGTTCPPGWSK